MSKVRPLFAFTGRVRKCPNRTLQSRRSPIVRAVGPVIDMLENRQLLSAVTFSNGIVTVTGSTTAANHMQVGLSTSGSELTANNGQGQLQTYDTSSVKGISIVGGSGNDYVYIDKAITVPATINSGDGNDIIRDGGGDNTIIAGNGNDFFLDQGSTALNLGNGADTVWGNNFGETITAGNGKDVITEGSGNNVITAGDGNDNISTWSGNDTISVGNGASTISSGPGNDSIVTGTGSDTVTPGDGTNVVTEGSSKTDVVPPLGTTTINTAPGTPSFPGSPVVTPPPQSPDTIPSTPVTGANSWVSHPASKSSDSSAPQAVAEVLAPALTVGIGVDVRAVASTVGAGSPVTTNYQWDFGDSSGEYNNLDGYNATHIYNTPGTYTIKLTVTNELNKVSTVSVPITIAPDTRKQIYVDSVNGNDANPGTINAPLKTATAADANVTANTEVFFKRGESFVFNSTFRIQTTNVVVGAYGSGADPIVVQPASSVNAVMFDTWYNNYGSTIQDLQFTTATANQTGRPFAIQPRGVDETVLRCTFLNVEYGINCNGSPIGLNVIDSSSPNSDGEQAYLVWAQGSDMSIIGNFAANSVREHIVRSETTNDILVADNTFTNNDGKGCIEIHAGTYAWVSGNNVTNGDIRVGPLGINEAVSVVTQYSTIEDNTVNHSEINVDSGAHDVSIRNNIIKQNADVALININSLDGKGRYVSDVYVLNNTGIDSNTFSNFLRVWSATQGIVMDNNLFVDPSLTVGAYTSAPVYVSEANLSNFTQITGNVWQTPAINLGWANGGINYVGSTWTSSGYLTINNWNNMSVVGTDDFANTTLNSNYAPASGSVAATADSAVAGMFNDFYGNARLTNGSGWSAGAVQV